MSDEHAYGLIFRSGFTTVEEMTEVSGRGIGLDAVLKTIREELSGTISVASKPGYGTTFKIIIPNKN